MEITYTLTPPNNNYQEVIDALVSAGREAYYEFPYIVFDGVHYGDGAKFKISGKNRIKVTGGVAT